MHEKEREHSRHLSILCRYIRGILKLSENSEGRFKKAFNRILTDKISIRKVKIPKISEDRHLIETIRYRKYSEDISDNKFDYLSSIFK